MFRPPRCEIRITHSAGETTHCRSNLHGPLPGRLLRLPLVVGWSSPKAFPARRMRTPDAAVRVHSWLRLLNPERALDHRVGPGSDCVPSPGPGRFPCLVACVRGDAFSCPSLFGLAFAPLVVLLVTVSRVGTWLVLSCQCASLPSAVCCLLVRVVCLLCEPPLIVRSPAQTWRSIVLNDPSESKRRPPLPSQRISTGQPSGTEQQVRWAAASHWLCFSRSECCCHAGPRIVSYFWTCRQVIYLLESAVFGRHQTPPISLSLPRTKCALVLWCRLILDKHYHFCFFFCCTFSCFGWTGPLEPST